MRTLHGSRCSRAKGVRHHFVLTSISFLDVVAEHSSLSFPTSFYPHQQAQDPDLQRLPHPWEEASGKKKKPPSPPAGVGCLAEWLTQLQSQILEEQYIDKEIDVPVMFQRKVPTARTVHQEQWRCIRYSLSTPLTTSPYTGRGKCREQAQHNGKILEVSGVMEHKFPPSQTTENGRSATGAVPSPNGGSLCRSAKTSAKGPKGTETRGSSQTELWTFLAC